MLDVQNLTKTFGDTRAVDDVSFNVESGRIFALIGPNGSGKTTIIKILAGLLQSTEGTLVIDENNITIDTQKAKQITGYIPDEPIVWSGMTGEEFMHMTGALYGMSEEARVQRIEELLPTFDLQGIEKEYFEQYSRGNKQKFSVLAALMHRPKLLLVDEPIVGLDPASVETVEHLFRDFVADGGTVLLTTHTLPVAERLSHRIGLLKTGKLVAVDTLDALKGQAELGHEASLEHVYMTLAS